MPHAVSPPSSVEKMMTNPKAISIDSTTTIDAIKAIPFEDTWTTYILNASNPIYNEQEWDNMSPDEKLSALLSLKPNAVSITSPFTQVITTADTDDNAIRKIPQKDCRHLLLAYANKCGFPQYANQIESMLVAPLRDELIKARDQLINSANDEDNTFDDDINTDIPFVITHDTTDDDIKNTSEEVILSELKSMFEERGQIDSIEWDSLTVEDLRDMARIERDEMVKCFSANETKKEKNLDDYRELISIHDDETVSSDEDTEMEDVDNADDHDNEENDADKFVKNEIDKENQTCKTFRFNIGYDTSNEEIFALTRRRAIRIAVKLANAIDSPLSDEFIQEATLEDVHQYIIIERDQRLLQYEYDKFQFSNKTTDQQIMKLSRMQLENFLIYAYRDSERELPETFFDNKSDMELKHHLIMERDLLKNSRIEEQQRQHRITQQPKAPNTLPKGLRGKRQNLNGWNIKSAMTNVGGNLHNTVFHPNQTTKSDVVPPSKNYFYIRANISTVGNGTHVPTIVRKFMKALRNSDPTIQLQPFDQDNNDQDAILDTESLLPDDPTAILTWVRGISSTSRRIYFSIRVSNTCLLKELRTDIFGWCKTNRCWIDMDYIASEKLFSCGWICGLHPRLYNRNELLDWKF